MQVSVNIDRLAVALCSLEDLIAAVQSLEQVLRRSAIFMVQEAWPDDVGRREAGLLETAAGWACDVVTLMDEVSVPIGAAVVNATRVTEGDISDWTATYVPLWQRAHPDVSSHRFVSGRRVGFRGLAPLEDPAFQHRVEEVLTDADGSAQRWINPRSHPVRLCLNDGGTDRDGRSSNCLDCTLAALASFYGLPTVALPVAGKDAEYGGTRRALKALGAGADTHLHFGGEATQDPAFIRGQYGKVLTHLRTLGPGSSALIITAWRGDQGGHAWCAVNPADDSGPCFWCPQTSRTWDLENLDPATIAETQNFHVVFIDANGKALPK